MKKIIMSLLERAREKGQQEEITEFLAKAMEKVKEDHPERWVKQWLRLISMGQTRRKEKLGINSSVN